jgi:hypothetical protein
MISEALRLKFQILETAMFDEWKQSNSERQREITKKLGVFEAKEIIKEIESKAKLETLNK